jgi:hypothetical protein
MVAIALTTAERLRTPKSVTRRRLPRLARFAFVTGSVAGLSSPALAQPRADEGLNRDRQVKTVVDYQASMGCPNRDAFLRQIQRRSSKVQFVSDPAGAHVLIVSVETGDKVATGRLTLQSASELGTPREVLGGSCKEVVSALALIAALAIDPEASTATLAPAPEPEPSPPIVDEQGSAAVGAAVAPPALVAPQAPARTVSPRFSGSPARTPVPRAQRASAAYQFATLVGAQIGSSLWPGPNPVYFASAGAYVEQELRYRDGWAPRVRLGVIHDESFEVHPAAGAARFRRTALTLDLCPVELQISRRLGLHPCAGAEGGVLGAEGIGDASVTHAQSSSRGWWALRQLLRFNLALGNHWFFELEAGLREALRHDTFVFHQPSVEIARVPVLEPFVALGGAYRF